MSIEVGTVVRFKPVHGRALARRNWRVDSVGEPNEAKPWLGPKLTILSLDDGEERETYAQHVQAA